MRTAVSNTSEGHERTLEFKVPLYRKGLCINKDVENAYHERFAIITSKIREIVEK